MEPNLISSINKFRELFLIRPEIVYLNHGSFGATPIPVFNAYQDWQIQLEKQPVEFLEYRHGNLMGISRSKLSDFLGTSPNNIVYTQNATMAINIVAKSLRLGPGDEVLSTQHEYGAVDRMWRILSKEYGYSYIKQEIKLPIKTKSTLIDNFWSGVTNRTRIVFISHISSPTAIIFPIREIIERSREKGIITIIDGAHAPGQIPLNLNELDPDFYCGSLHKWLFAPKGSGFLYARPSVQE